MNSTRRSVRAAAVLMLFVVVTACVSVADAKTQRPAGDQRVTVTIDSRPDHGEIYVDGSFIGTAPAAHRMIPGVHAIEVKREGFTTWCRELTVTPENPTRVVALLKQER